MLFSLNPNLHCADKRPQIGEKRKGDEKREVVLNIFNSSKEWRKMGFSKKMIILIHPKKKKDGHAE